MGAGKTLPLEPRLIIISNPTKTDTLYDTKHRIMVTTTPSFLVFILKLLWVFFLSDVEPSTTYIITVQKALGKKVDHLLSSELGFDPQLCKIMDGKIQQQ